MPLSAASSTSVQLPSTPSRLRSCRRSPGGAASNAWSISPPAARSSPHRSPRNSRYGAGSYGFWVRRYFAADTTRAIASSRSTGSAERAPPGFLARAGAAASFIFKWHPVFAPRYGSIIRGAELIVSFMTLAEMRQGALDANWGQCKWDLLEAYLADFSVLNSDNLLCSTWAQ